MSRTVVFFLTLFVGGLPFVDAADISSAELQAIGLEVRWTNQTMMDVGRDGVRFVTNDEANVYVQSTSGMMSCFHAENGRKLWNAQVGRTDEPGMMAVSNSQTLLVIAGPMAYAFNKFNGIPLFEFRLPTQPSAAPGLNEGAFYIPLSGGSIYAYSLSVLEYRTKYGKLPDDVITPHMWRFICAEEVTHPPVVGERAISFATESKSLFSVETSGIARGRTRCQLLLNRSATADLAVAGNKGGSSVVMLTGENRIFSVDMMTGNTEWTYPMGRKMNQIPVIIGNHVYVVAVDGTMVKIERDESSPSWGRPLEMPAWQAPMLIGAGMFPTEADAAVAGLVVENINEGSTAAAAGLQPGDVITSIDGVEVTSIEAAQGAISELPLRVERTIEVTRGDTFKRLDIRIPAIKWEAIGVRSLTAVGRFGVYGIDMTERLVGFDLQTSRALGRVNIQGYPIHPHNSSTDQVYLVSKSGEVVCLREIGPTVRMPELTSVSNEAMIKSVRLNRGASIDAAGTVVCEVELPGGDIHEIASNHPGSVREIYIRPGQVVRVGEPLILIADDKFATYHQNPQQRPIDVELGQPQAAAPKEGDQ